MHILYDKVKDIREFRCVPDKKPTVLEPMNHNYDVAELVLKSMSYSNTSFVSERIVRLMVLVYNQDRFKEYRSMYVRTVLKFKECMHFTFKDLSIRFPVLHNGYISVMFWVEDFDGNVVNVKQSEISAVLYSIINPYIEKCSSIICQHYWVQSYSDGKLLINTRVGEFGGSLSFFMLRDLKYCNPSYVSGQKRILRLMISLHTDFNRNPVPVIEFEDCVKYHNTDKIRHPVLVTQALRNKYDEFRTETMYNNIKFWLEDESGNIIDKKLFDIEFTAFFCS